MMIIISFVSDSLGPISIWAEPDDDDDDDDSERNSNTATIEQWQ